MDLRWRLVVVLGAGDGLGADVAERLARLGAGLVVVDPDAAAARALAASVAVRRVSAWSLGADVTEAEDRRVLAARCRDLGGADALVNPTGAWAEVAADFLAGLDHRRGRRDDAAVVDVVPRGLPTPWCRAAEDRARLTTLTAVSTDLGADPVPAARVVLDLLRSGTPGERRDLA